MSAENTGHQDIQTPRLTRREFLHTILLGTVGFVAVSNFDVPAIDIPQTVTLTQTPAEKPAEAPHAAPAVVQRIPAPYERRLVLPMVDDNSDSRLFKALLNEWKHLLADEGADAQLIDTEGTGFRVQRGVVVRKKPFKDVAEAHNIIDPRGLRPGQLGFNRLRIRINYEDRMEPDVWLPIHYNKKTHTGDISPAGTTPGVIAFAFKGQQFLRDVNVTSENSLPSYYSEIPW